MKKIYVLLFFLCNSLMGYGQATKKNSDYSTILHKMIIEEIPKEDIDLAFGTEIQITNLTLMAILFKPLLHYWTYEYTG